MMFKTSASPLALLLLLALPAPALSQIAAREPEIQAPSDGKIETFALPDGVSWGTTIRLDGDPSLAPTNRTLEQGFNQQFPGAFLQIAAHGSDHAIQNLLDGKIDIAAIGRRLTRQERARGLIAVPVARHKIAIIIGPENPFLGSLTNQQFAQIFRGEVTNWEAVGGEPGVIRLIDRPKESDTRRAFAYYPVFQDRPFQAGTSAIQVNDHTDDVIKALGPDGIGYAMVDQVSERPDVKIVPLHDVLPSDSRYAFSQPIAYVYKGPVASPAAQAFLGYANAASQAGALVAHKTAAAALGRSGELPGAFGKTPGQLAGNGNIGLIAPQSQTNPPESDRSNLTAKSRLGEALPVFQSPAWESPQTEIQQQEIQQREAQQTAEQLQLNRTTSITVSESSRKLGWWWLLLPLAIIPFLLRWLMQQSNVLGTEGNPPHIDGALEGSFGEHHGTISGLTGAALSSPRQVSPQVVLVPRDCHHAYAYWELPESVDARDQRFGSLKLRLYDLSASVTGDRPFQQYDCRDDDLQVPIRHDNHEYQVELGYLSHRGKWHRVAESDAVLVPACAVQEQTDDGCRIVIMPCDPHRFIYLEGSQNAHPQAYVYWDISEKRRQRLRQQGGRILTLRIHDADSIDIEHQAPHQTDEYVIDEQARDKVVAISEGDRDYVAEIGYRTLEGKFLSLGRSVHARIPRLKSASS